MRKTEIGATTGPLNYSGPEQRYNITSSVNGNTERCIHIGCKNFQIGHHHHHLNPMFIQKVAMLEQDDDGIISRSKKKKVHTKGKTIV